MPEATFRAVQDHGGPANDTVTGTQDAARSVFARLAELDIDMDDVTEQLETEGIDKFDASWSSLIGTVTDGLKAAGAQAEGE